MGYFTTEPLGLVLRPAPQAPSQAQVLAFDPSGGQPAPLATFQAVPPVSLSHPMPMLVPLGYEQAQADYEAWLAANPASPLSRVHSRGVQAHYATQTERDAAMVAALADPDVEGVFVPENLGYWIYPQQPVAGQPFALFSAFNACETHWTTTPFPAEFDTGTDPIRFVGLGGGGGCGVPPPIRWVMGWHLPGLEQGMHQIAIYDSDGSGIPVPHAILSVNVVAGVGASAPGPVTVPALGPAALAGLALACVAAVLLLRKLRAP